MATIIETKSGFIAGDPPETLPVRHHWCSWCGGDGLEYGDEPGDLQTCGACVGSCTTLCDDADCEAHPGLHNRVLDGYACNRCGAEPDAMVPDGVGERGQLFRCADTCRVEA